MFKLINISDHNNEAQPSRGTERSRDEEQIRTEQTPRMKPQTHKERKKERTTVGEMRNK